ncbi:hypothetical protein MKW98_021414 [Papaver atlanticum]|uniref:Uncharacterized protein n=1 Tax=Papaver atlanticum TaxID=357466 RepID=A0AAD4SR18_9MAGN|nr:hypothetical protein MKW98_021414 [Papaver atlanticum]
MWGINLLSWCNKVDLSGAINGDHQQSTRVFPKGNPEPSIKSLTLFRPGTFTIDVQYADAADQLQVLARINTYAF